MMSFIFWLWLIIFEPVRPWLLASYSVLYTTSATFSTGTPDSATSLVLNVLCYDYLEKIWHLFQSSAEAYRHASQFEHSGFCFHSEHLAAIWTPFMLSEYGSILAPSNKGKTSQIIENRKKTRPHDVHLAWRHEHPSSARKHNIATPANLRWKVGLQKKRRYEISGSKEFSGQIRTAVNRSTCTRRYSGLQNPVF